MDGSTLARLGVWLLVIAVVHTGAGSALAAADYTANKDHEFGEHYQIHNFNCTSFPSEFIFGTGSAAYQVEGAWNSDGKGPSIWDAYAHAYPERIQDRSSGDVAADSYHHYKEDVELLKNMNMDAYRFSISWPRILPSGRVAGGVNGKGIEYYNHLIDHLVTNGIKPLVTLFHWDTPEALELEYGGFLHRQIIEDFREFANLCFEKFGDRVKHWITLNEPFSYAVSGYDWGTSPPYRCSAFKKNPFCAYGDSGIEPYMVMHNLILAHAHSARLYKTKFQAHQKGIVGISVVSSWMIPYSNSLFDRRATKRGLEFQMGWNLGPLVYGDYPKSMRKLVGNRLPKFSKEESDLVKGSSDFFGMNYYTSSYVKDLSHIKNKLQQDPTYSTDALANVTITERNGKLIGESAGLSWLHLYPKGLREMLLYIKHEYKDPIIYITENGVDEKNDPNVPLETVLKDHFRIKYYYQHLKYLRQAIHEGVKVRGFFGWAAFDNFEWSNGYTVRFGINYVDFKNGHKRYPKLSAKWFRRFLSPRTRHQ